VTLPGKVSLVAATIEVVDRGTPLAFTIEDLMRYHGPTSPGGVAHAFKVLERALPLLGPCERRAVEVTTAFGGPTARDAFELVLRAITTASTPRWPAPNAAGPWSASSSALPTPGARSRSRCARAS
jgi:hypothetical protein